MADTNLSQVENVFHAALDLPEGDRSRYIKEACNGDERLAAEVSSLVSTFEHSNGFMEQSAVSLGLSVINRSSQESLIGKTFGVYRIISQLGKGGMGEVYLAEDTRLNRKVALKFLSQELVDDKWAKRQLVKEAQAAAMLDHANICPVYGIEEHGEHTFIVMQFVEGETLCELIQKHSITPEQTISLARQIAGALAEAHAHGIIHRDIKPRNIMVTNGGTVKVLDFGLAKSVLPKSLESLEDSISKFTDVGLVPGTIRYMSPEQLCNERLDYRSDLFSVGTVLYEIVSGKNPFERKTGPEVISAILSSSPQPLKQNGSKASGLVPIISRCLSKDREQRFQSASELLIDLDKLEKGIAANRMVLYWLRPLAILAVLLLTVGAAVYYYYFGLTAKRHSVAVLDIQCEDIPNEVCPGATIRQQLISQLSRRSDLVIQTSSASELPPDEKTRSELGVETILTGKIIRRGDSLVLKTRLYGAAKGNMLHENQHLLPSQAIPLLEELSIRLVFYPDAAITEKDKQSYAVLAALQSRNPEAVELYFRGKHYWDRRDKDNIPRAIGFFEQAIEKDPVYALAYAGLANCYAVSPTPAYGMAKTKAAMEKATAAAKKALEIDSNLAEAHIALGMVQLRYDWNWKAAEKSFTRAIELQPDSPSAYYWYSNVLGITGRVNEAIAASEKAKQLDPLTPQYVTNLGRAFYWARDFDKTIDYFRGVLAEKSDNTSAMYMLSLAYLQKQWYTDAIILLEKLTSLDKKWLAASLLGYAYAKVGREREARNILNEMDTPPEGVVIPAQERAIVYIGLGDHDSAFYWLEKSYEERFGSIIALNIDALFDDLRRDPRFPVLVRKINLVP